MPRRPRQKKKRSPPRAKPKARPAMPQALEEALNESAPAEPEDPEELEAVDVAPLMSKTFPYGGVRHPLTVVGVGASAGGLEAFSQLLAALPPDLGMAIVLVQHLAPQHESALPVLLSGVSPMPVIQVSEGMRVEANRVYVIPPNVQMDI